MAKERNFLAGEKLDRRRKGRLSAAVSADPPEEFEQLQYQRLLAVVPLLYIAIAINTLASAVASQGDFPTLYQWVFPAILACASVVRFGIWWRRRSRPVSLEVARRHLRFVVLFAAVLGSFAGIWSVLAFFETHETRRVMAATFVALGAFAATNCLASVPRAAVAAVVCSLGPISLALLLSGDLAAMGASLILCAVLQLRLVFSQYHAMRNSHFLQQTMRELADTDSLTGLKNRRALDRAIKDTINGRAGFALVLLDLNDFKLVNDRHGHAIGDALLVQVAERLTAYADNDAVIARLGGDEFAILVRTVNHKRDLERGVARLTKMLAMAYVCDEKWLSISASAGIARFGVDGRTATELFRFADRAVYQAKSDAKPAPEQLQKPIRRKAA